MGESGNLCGQHESARILHSTDADLIQSSHLLHIERAADELNEETSVLSLFRSH